MRRESIRQAAWITLLTAFLVSMRAAISSDEFLGRWQDDDGSNIYQFQANNQFQFSGIERVWIQHQGFAGNPFANLPRSREPRGQYMQQRKEFNGAWETGRDICSATLPELGKVSGNVKIYVGTVECCMEAKRLGPTLVLRAISAGEAASAKPDRPEICVNRVLRERAADGRGGG